MRPLTSAAAALLMMSSAALAETPMPLKTPLELDAARGSNPAGMQVMTFQHKATYPLPGHSDTVTLSIGPDSFSFREGDRNMAVDFKLGRVFSILPDGHYFSYPAEAAIIQRVDERINRDGMVRMLKAMPRQGSNLAALDQTMDTFWMASELHIVMPSDPKPDVTQRDEDPASIWSHGGVDTVTYTPGEVLPTPLAKVMRKALLWTFPGEPSILSQISGHVPSHLSVTLRVAGSLATDDYVLSKSKWCAECRAIPAAASPLLTATGTDPFGAAMWPVMAAAVQGKTHARTEADYFLLTDKAAADKNSVSALLWFSERALQYPGAADCQAGSATKPCQEIAAIRALGADPSIKALSSVLGGPCGANCADAFAPFRTRAPAQGYMLDLFQANKLTPHPWVGNKEAEGLFASALAGMPNVPPVYRDISAYYMRSAEPVPALRTMEMAQFIGGSSADPKLWEALMAAEQNVRARYPDFF